MKQIEFIKEEFSKPTPILYTYKGCIEQSLVTHDFNNAVGITLKTAVNETATLSFTIPFSADRKIDWISLEKLIYFQGIYFIINEIETTDGSEKDIKVSCEEISCSLKGIYCENITCISMLPIDIFQAIVTASKMDIGYKWLGTDIPSNVFRHVITESETSVYENLMSLAEVFNATIEFSYNELGEGYIYLRKNVINTGKFIKKNIDMKSLTITSTSKEIYSKILCYGRTDDYGITVDIQDVNNGNAILTDYSYYQAMGIPDNIIIKEPQYNQTLTLTDDKYTTSSDLLIYAKEQLAKNSIPQWTAEIQLTDLAIYVDSPIEVPRVMMGLRCIDKEIDFIFDCQIVSVERNFDNPANISLEISNVIPYSTNTQKTGRAIEIVDEITSSNPIGDDGTITGDGNNFVIGNKVLDGEHINIIRRVGNVQSLIQANFDSIQLRVDDLDKSYSQILQTANSITSTVASLDNGVATAKSEIIQTADKISVKVSKGEMGSMIEQNPQSVKVSWNQNSRYCNLDDTEGLQLGDASTGTYSKVNYNGTLELYSAGSTKPYHCLSYTTVYHGLRGNGKEYREYNYPLPSMFNSIENPDENIAISASVAKVFDSNDGSECLQYWSGAYAGIVDGQIQLNVMSTFRDYTYASGETGHWVDEFSEPREGYIDVSITIIA